MLTDDGVIFISMADNELSNLLKICEEVFGKKNIEIFVWKKKGGASNTERILGVLTEYVICCFNNKKPNDFNYQDIKREYKYKDSCGVYNLEGIEKTNLGTYERKTMYFGIIDPSTGQEFWPSDGMRWTLGENTVKEMIAKDKIFFDYKNMRVRRIKRPEDYELSENVYYNLLSEEGSLAAAKEECNALLGNRELFDTPKPTMLIKKLLRIAARNNSIILDFFSGSATTAHAVMQLNAEDGGKRKYIMVQLPEKCDEKSEAFKAGYKNICDIGKERLRRAGKKILQEKGEMSVESGVCRVGSEVGDNSTLHTSNSTLDVVFRVLKLDSSNMKDVYYKPSDYSQGFLGQLEDNIKADRTPLDLLFQVMLDLGKPLSAKIEEREIAGKRVFVVDDNDLVACFDSNITEDVVKTIAQLKPLYAVFRDSGLSSDSVGANFDQIFATYSPNTTRKVL